MHQRLRTIIRVCPAILVALLLVGTSADARFVNVTGYCSPGSGWEQGNNVFVQCTVQGEPDSGGWYITWASAWTLFGCPFAVIATAWGDAGEGYIISHAYIEDEWSHLEPSIAGYSEGYDDTGTYLVTDEDIGPCLCITADQYP